MLTTLVGLFGVLLVVLVVIPLFRGQSPGHDYKFAEHWSGYGSSQKEILLNFLNPVNHLRVIFTASKVQRMNILFSGFIFLPFFSFRSLMFLIFPAWFMLYSSDYWLLNGPFLYYGMLIIPFLFYGAIVGIENFCRKWVTHKDRIYFWATTLILLVQVGQSTLFRQFLQVEWRPDTRYTSTALAIIASLPPEATVAAQSHLVPHVPPRSTRVCFPFNLEKVEYIFLDFQGNTWPFSAGQYSACVDTLRTGHGWITQTEKDGFLLLQRRK
jgi:uncharacterized membrane protein